MIIFREQCERQTPVVEYTPTLVIIDIIIYNIQYFQILLFHFYIKFHFAPPEKKFSDTPPMQTFGCAD